MKAASECSRKTGFRASISNLHPFPKTLKKKKRDKNKEEIACVKHLGNGHSCVPQPEELAVSHHEVNTKSKGDLRN